MKASQRKGGAVGRDQKVAAVEIGRMRRDQMQLDGPLAELRPARDLGRGVLRGSWLELPCLTPGASHGEVGA